MPQPDISFYQGQMMGSMNYDMVRPHPQPILHHPPSMGTPPDQMYDVPRSFAGSHVGSVVGSQKGSQVGFPQRQGSLIGSQMNDYQVPQQQRWFIKPILFGSRIYSVVPLMLPRFWEFSGDLLATIGAWYCCSSKRQKTRKIDASVFQIQALLFQAF